METMSFAEVWNQYQEAKNRLLEYFSPRIIGLARKYLWDSSEAEDVGHSALASIIEKHGKELRGVEDAEALWDLFAAITLRHCRKHQKRNYRASRRRGALPVGPGNEDSAPAYDPSDQDLPPDIRAGIADLFEECQKRLSGRQKDIFLGMLDGMERKDLSAALRVSIPTVDREIKKIKTLLLSLAGEQ